MTRLPGRARRLKAQILELAVPPIRASDGTYDGRDATGSRLLALFHPLLGVTFKAT
jgi:hypothetical protein